jgi:hypothetical protein
LCIFSLCVRFLEDEKQLVSNQQRHGIGYEWATGEDEKLK